jgi:hypothetical protein
MPRSISGVMSAAQQREQHAERRPRPARLVRRVDEQRFPARRVRRLELAVRERLVEQLEELDREARGAQQRLDGAPLAERPEDRRAVRQQESLEPLRARGADLGDRLERLRWQARGDKDVVPVALAEERVERLQKLEREDARPGKRHVGLGPAPRHCAAASQASRAHSRCTPWPQHGRIATGCVRSIS